MPKEGLAWRLPALSSRAALMVIAFAIPAFLAVTAGTGLRAGSPFICEAAAIGENRPFIAASLRSRELVSHRAGLPAITIVNPAYFSQTGVTLWDELKSPRPRNVNGRISSGTPRRSARLRKCPKLISERCTKMFTLILGVCGGTDYFPIAYPRYIGLARLVP